jgi:hypothetical protein
VGVAASEDPGAPLEIDGGLGWISGVCSGFVILAAIVALERQSKAFEIGEGNCGGKQVESYLVIYKVHYVGLSHI